MISKYLVKENIIDEDDKEIYDYGEKQIILFLGNIIISIIIGLLMNMIASCMIFSISYIALRNNAGGYHAKSQTWCYIYSTIMVVLALMGVNYVYSSPLICIGVLAISTLIIMKLAPIEAKNKPLDTMEVIVYRRRTITILWSLILIALTLLFLDFHIYFGSIVVAIICVSIMLILGKYLTAE